MDASSAILALDDLRRHRVIIHKNGGRTPGGFKDFFAGVISSGPSVIQFRPQTNLVVLVARPQLRKRLAPGPTRLPAQLPLRLCRHRFFNGGATPRGFISSSGQLKFPPESGLSAQVF
ncbi:MULTISPECIES: hypothetical protein [unclassified Neorhizobium]|uniref:hypothetical protein n=1 Tax=unclassified Neorhizobium TaxID=2629175 RepID=UPI001FF4E864|nr:MULTISPECIES: hypothetical protein [unclassified Neorhizobium]MCJ9672052.1 hypothetical protein [Neorhizobium sp. SHOUNA12B]MCJ9746333.1 hypothetical protein [Neorhizobium sp. SHOUNA12A]